MAVRRRSESDAAARWIPSAVVRSLTNTVVGATACPVKAPVVCVDGRARGDRGDIASRYKVLVSDVDGTVWKHLKGANGRDDRTSAELIATHRHVPRALFVEGMETTRATHLADSVEDPLTKPPATARHGAGMSVREPFTRFAGSAGRRAWSGRWITPKAASRLTPPSRIGALWEASFQ